MVQNFRWIYKNIKIHISIKQMCSKFPFLEFSQVLSLIWILYWFVSFQQKQKCLLKKK